MSGDTITVRTRRSISVTISVVKNTDTQRMP
jgi:hypothetical protein